MRWKRLSAIMPVPGLDPGLSRASTSFLPAFSQKDVDGWDKSGKPGHDSEKGKRAL
jgi:hypothetical protein